MGKKEGETKKELSKITDIDAVNNNVSAAVQAFANQWVPWPKYDLDVEVMDVGRLRDAMGLRATIDIGDPWPTAEQQLLSFGFRWQILNGQRVMYLKEKEGFKPDTGWQEAEEVKNEE